jgi:hypothetical protein
MRPKQLAIGREVAEILNLNYTQVVDCIVDGFPFSGRYRRSVRLANASKDDGFGGRSAVSKLNMRQ